MVPRYVFVLKLCVACVVLQFCGVTKISADELENHISPDDLQMFLDMYNTTEDDGSKIQTRFAEDEEVPEAVDCFGLGSFMSKLPWIFNLKPDSSENVNTHFFFSSRNKPERVPVQMVQPGESLNLELVDFRANRRTVVIIHGFMSYSNSSWVHEMTRAFLQWADVNVIAVDWSDGGNTWKYWRAVANTRRVSADVSNFLLNLKNATGANFKDFHLVGHSLGAHISSFVSYLVGGVARITGLDPAQPCFRTDDLNERLDDTDADFVDVIHTNGRLLKRIGFGLPEQIGHADFYPNGGMKQPGCRNETKSFWSGVIPFYGRLQQAICSHGRSYLLFTESLINNECAFQARKWNLTYEGLDWYLISTCKKQRNCVEMGIKAEGGQGLRRANGPYFTWTTDKEPYCPTDHQVSLLRPHLLLDLIKGFRLNSTLTSPSDSNSTSTDSAPSSASSIKKDCCFSKLAISLLVLILLYFKATFSNGISRGV